MLIISKSTISSATPAAEAGFCQVTKRSLCLPRQSLLTITKICHEKTTDKEYQEELSYKFSDSSSSFISLIAAFMISTIFVLTGFITNNQTSQNSPQFPSPIHK